jgi:hypothetical protein
LGSEAERTYCIDTSALVWLQRNIEKNGPFHDVWDALAELIRAGRVFAPDVVLVEIARGSDDLETWCRQFPTMFRAPTIDVANVVGELGGRHQGFVNSLKPDDEADPWVVAWTLLENERLKGVLFGGECIAVSSEGTRTNHIADVCAKEGVRCVTLQAMLGLEGLKFARS